MIEITKIDGNNIYYKCTCGAIGKCMIRPIGNSQFIIVNVFCAICNKSERVTLAQETNNISPIDVSWALVVSNEVI